ncbi:MAG: hypothetical protein JXR37_19745 [Kiritimatiellae bacterium]|nr:hypothetical protein [Kiritimatiellia bacterium]
MEESSRAFVESLAEEGRVLLLGGLAVIAHGLTRATTDIDVWLDPLSSAAEWAGLLRRVLARFGGAKPYDLRAKCVVACVDIETVVDRDGVVRVVGLDRPIDVFRVPHNLSAEDFAEVWRRAGADTGSARLPDAIDLLVTKEETARPQDVADVSFLEEKVRRRLGLLLRGCGLPEAKAAFERYADHETCRAALENPDAGVRELALNTLREFAADGDPFAGEILAAHESAHES